VRSTHQADAFLGRGRQWIHFAHVGVFAEFTDTHAQNERQPIPDVPAVYFVRGSEAAVSAVAADAAKGLYDTMHLNFAPGLPPHLLEKLAAAVVASGSVHRISKVRRDLQ